MINNLNCPECNAAINVDDWFWNFSQKADNAGLYYFTCGGCKIKLGSTLGMTGKVSIWDKSTEIK